MAALCLRRGYPRHRRPRARLLSLCHQRFAKKPGYRPGPGSALPLRHVRRLGRREQELNVRRSAPRGSTLWPAAALAWLLPAARITRRLDGCAGTGRSERPERRRRTGDPTYRERSPPKARAVLKNYAPTITIRDCRSALGARPDQGLDLVSSASASCDHGQARNYALFLDEQPIVDDRFAVQTDGCDTQTYSPFDLMPTGLAPLH